VNDENCFEHGFRFSKALASHQVGRIVGGCLYQVNTIKTDNDYFYV